MAELKGIMSRQTELGTNIEKLLLNFGKDSKSRKTKEYVVSRIGNLNELWREFEANDDKIRELCSDPAGHEYFSKEYYNQVEQVYLKLKSQLNERLDELGSNEEQGELRVKEGSSTNNNVRLTQLGKSIQFTMGTLQGILDQAMTAEVDSTIVQEHIISRIEKFLKLMEQKEKELFSLVKNDELPFPLDEYHHIQNRAEQTLIMLRAVQVFKSNHRSAQPTKSHVTPLTALELDKASCTIFKLIQTQAYNAEIKCLNDNQALSNRSHLTSLTPFVDHYGLLRVGGRLQQSTLSYDEQHPILIPPTHFVTRLYMAALHVKHLHAGPNALTAISRQRVWIPQGRQLARSIVNSCIRCARARPYLARQIMGQLPANRVTPARPFINCGVDFCGPVWVHFKIRGKRPQKAYIAVFCCFSTKAVHLEVVSDLTADAFIGSLKRFMSRRGACQNIYCDNATNFVGACNRISELQEIISNNKDKILSHCSDRRIQFHFIPPRAPHMGGLWEAAVKSAKQLLCRTVASTALTYEELCTITTEIEAVLNSRPIGPMSSDPNDLNALTPGHFLIGEPMTATVDPHATNASMGLMSRWQLVSYCRKEFWKRWSIEYLTSLQQRAKWSKEYPNMLTDTLVLIKEENVPPLQWSLGRVVTLINGPDGRVRVADVRTPSGVLRRPIHTLAPLPIEVAEDESVAHQEVTPLVDNQTTPKAKRKKQSNTVTLTTAVVMLLVFLPLIAASKVTIHKLEGDAGIFYNYQGEMRVIPTYWNLMVYVKLDGCRLMEEHLTTTLEQMKTTAARIHPNTPYFETIRYFEGRIRQALLYRSIVGKGSKISERMKRSPMNIVGTVFNKLFGVLDDEYAEEMKTTISNVQSNEQVLRQLLNNHTSIIDATVNVFKRETQELLNHTIELRKVMQEDYVSVSNQLAEQTTRQMSSERFNLLAIVLTSYLIEYTQLQDTIADITLGLKQGHISVHIISPEQLQEQLKVIRDELPPSLSLPQDRLSDLNSLYKVMAIKGVISGEYYLFKIQIPLLLENHFKLYQIITVPIMVNNTQMRIVTTTDYVGADLHNNKFYALSSKDMSNCIMFSESLYLCHQDKPIEDDYAEAHQCESRLMFAKQLPSECSVTYHDPRNWWRQLSDTSSWLYALTHPCDATILCADGTTEQVTIRDVGIVSLQRGCTLRTKKIVLNSFKNMTTTLNLSIQPKFNLSDFGTPTGHRTIMGLPNNTKFEDNWGQLEKQLQQLQTNQIELTELQPRDVHQYSISYVSLGLIIIVIIVWGYRKVQQCKKNQPVAPKSEFELQTFQRERREDVETA